MTKYKLFKNIPGMLKHFEEKLLRLSGILCGLAQGKHLHRADTFDQINRHQEV